MFVYFCCFQLKPGSDPVHPNLTRTSMSSASTAPSQATSTATTTTTSHVKHIFTLVKHIFTLVKHIASFVITCQTFYRPSSLLNQTVPRDYFIYNTVGARNPNSSN